ncbi:YiiG family protein [Methylobacterium sp. 1973]|uniref:YiiG family protein n=1 Tax=Methylobacterium sp. 1973 TaxID=3156421 RepID=UPI00339B638E
MRTRTLTATTWLVLTTLLAAAPARAQAPASAPASASAPAGQASKPDVDPAQETIRKLNAYVGLLNRTLRAQESLSRYQSWVNMKTGPTGRERIIYGLYGLYDVRGEIAKAEAATAQPPAMPNLDGAMTRYIAAYQALAPTITEAEGYYERQDYRADKMEQGKALHAKLAVAGPAFLAARAQVDAALRVEKEKSNALELAAIEAREGRKARWHVANVMTEARKVMDLLPTDAKPVVDMAAFEAALGRYAVAVKDLDGYSAANPNAFHVFESRPRALLGKLREFDAKLAKAKGDARRGAGRDVTWIVNDYNTMVSTAQTATTFSR